MSIRDFGARCDGVTDDTGAIQSALNSGAIRITISNTGSDCKVTEPLVVPAKTVLNGPGKYGTGIIKFFDGDLISLEAHAGLRDLRLHGNRAFHTGRNVVIKSGYGQWLDNVSSSESSGYDVEYTAPNVGSQSFIINSHLGGRVLHIAVKYPSLQDSSAVPRSIINSQGGGAVLLDFGASVTSYFMGNFTNGLVFSSANSINAIVIGNRIATGGATTTINGVQHHIVGNIFAGPVILSPAAKNVVFDSDLAPNWDITDAGVDNSVTIKERLFIPRWTGTTNDPQLGNGTLQGRWSRSGNVINFQIDLTIGSTTTLGAGTWFFSLPKRDKGTGVVQIAGPAWAQLAAGNAEIGVVRVELSQQKVSVFFKDTAGLAANFGHAKPFQWTAGSILRLSGAYSSE